MSVAQLMGFRHTPTNFKHFLGLEEKFAEIYFLHIKYKLISQSLNPKSYDPKSYFFTFYIFPFIFNHLQGIHYKSVRFYELIKFIIKKSEKLLSMNKNVDIFE